MNDSELLISTRVKDYFPPLFIAFSRSSFEENSRIFFDCPENSEHHSFTDHIQSSTMMNDVETVGEIRDVIDFSKSDASWLSGGRFVFFLLIFWINHSFTKII